MFGWIEFVFALNYLKRQNFPAMNISYIEEIIKKLKSSQKHRWRLKKIKDNINEVAVGIIGYKEKRDNHWFDGNREERTKAT